MIWEKAAVAGERKGERACDRFFYDPLVPIISRLDSAVKLSNFNLLESLDSHFPRKYLALFEHRKCEEYRLRISQSIVPSERGFN